MRWAELRITAPPESREAVAQMLIDAGCRGAAEDSREPALLKGYLPASDTIQKTLETVRDRLDRLPEFGLPAAGGITLRWVEEEDWENAWKAWFKPLEVGRRLVIKPTWETYSGDRLVVELDPGMAFGTGGHPSTRLCLEALEEQVRAGATVADIGTGSGILSLAAAALGAARVLATDIDSLPRKIARENVARSGLESVVQVLEMDEFDREARDCDLVVANIIADTIVELAPGIFQRLAPGGVFIAAGIVEERLPDVEAALDAAGFSLLQVREEEIWRCTVCRRP